MGNSLYHREDLLLLLSQHRKELERYGVRSLAFFGSVARNEARADSDIDLLVEFDTTPDFNLFMDLKFFLEDLLKCRVDLVTQKALKPRLRDRINSEAIRVPGL